MRNLNKGKGRRMTVEKFGLKELERYEAKVGFKKSDVRTIKGVCVIVDLPLTVVPEVSEVIAACNKDVIASEKQIAKIKTDDARNNEETKQGISRLKAERESTKRKNEQAITTSKVSTGNSNGEIARLQKLLKNFS